MTTLENALKINNGKAVLLSIKKEWLSKIILESNKTIENKENALTLYKIMKDADALDRVRFGLMDLDERYLRFNASKQHVLTAKVCLESITDGK